MSIGGAGAHFRSPGGCCICGTKSSSSRFTGSHRYATHLPACFGSGASQRSGDLCNACVLCVKRWLQRGKQPNLFSRVLDSKHGPGPKHMKEITKRARRRKARDEAVLNGSSSEPTSQQNSHQNISSNASASRAFSSKKQHTLLAPCCVACWVGPPEHLNPATNAKFSSSAPINCQSVNSGSSKSTIEGATMTRAAAARKLDAAIAFAAEGLDASIQRLNSSTPNKKSTTGQASVRSSGSSSLSYSSGCCPNCCQSTKRSRSYCKGGFGERRSSDSSGFWAPSEDDESNVPSENSEFRQPPPPSGRTTRAGRLSTVSASELEHNPADDELQQDSSVYARYSADALSTTSITPPMTPRRYNRRVQLPPVKMTDSVEVNALLRQIMEKNSQAINFDRREMHMAVQRELRLRNRTVNASSTPGTLFSGSTSLSGFCSSSLDYASEFSSIENGSLEESHYGVKAQPKSNFSGLQRNLRRN